MLRKNLFVFVLAVLIFFPALSVSSAADSSSMKEREALALRVELNRLGNSGDPFEREMILQKIIDRCKGTEEAIAAYWDLADLYLDAFPEEMRQEACEMLELCLKNYPDSPKKTMIECKLVDLYETGDSKRAELIRQLQNDKSLPNILRSSLK